jgi:hypothetical protein
MLLARPDPEFWGEVALTYCGWQPTADGETIPERPIDRILAGAAADIDLQLGSNTYGRDPPQSLATVKRS